MKTITLEHLDSEIDAISTELEKLEARAGVAALSAMLAGGYPLRIDEFNKQYTDLDALITQKALERARLVRARQALVSGDI